MLPTAVARLTGSLLFRHCRPVVQYLQRIAQGIPHRLAQLSLDVHQDQPEYRETLLAQLQPLPDQSRHPFRCVTIIELFIVFVPDIQWKITAIRRDVPCTNSPPPPVNLSDPRNNA